MARAESVLTSAGPAIARSNRSGPNPPSRPSRRARIFTADLPARRARPAVPPTGPHAEASSSRSHGIHRQSGESAWRPSRGRLASPLPTPFSVDAKTSLHVTGRNRVNAQIGGRKVPGPSASAPVWLGPDGSGRAEAPPGVQGPRMPQRHGLGRRDAILTREFPRRRRCRRESFDDGRGQSEVAPDSLESSSTGRAARHGRISTYGWGRVWGPRA